jgi:cytosine/adenosine deaminase-related metal-dependent hydrolase
MKLALEGTIVPLRKSRPKESFAGRVYLRENGRIAGVKWVGKNPPTGFNDVPVVSVGDAFIYPGLIDLHSHIAYNALPLWHREEERRPYLHHDIWPGRDGYKQNVGWPAWLLARGAAEELMAYVQVQALAGGTTAVQGWPTFNRRPANQLVRNLDDQSFEDKHGGRDNMQTSALTLDGEALLNKAKALEQGKGFIYHCAEGQKGSRVVKEFDNLGTANCLRERLIAIHCCAVGEEAFKKWKDRANLMNGERPGAIVWSPFSNLWLYGREQTSDVPGARRHGVKVCLGTDWGPSGTKNLLGELKAARLCADDLGWQLSDFDLVEMVTGSPGDMLHRIWKKRVGRLVTHGLGDLAVVKRTFDDPWKNLVHAREEHVLLVMVDSRPRYGKKALMEACGARATTWVRVGSAYRRIVLKDPIDEDKPFDERRPWSWKKVLAQLEWVRQHPTLEWVKRLTASATGVAAPESRRRLIIELDMPGALGMVAGPPPAGKLVDIAPIPSLRHDRNWRREVKGRGFHQGVFNDLDRFYA